MEKMHKELDEYIEDGIVKDELKRIIALKKGQLVELKDIITDINCTLNKKERLQLVDVFYIIEHSFNNISNRDSLYFELRQCSECGNVMIDGYIIEGGEYYYCSDSCKEKNMSDEEFEELCANDEGETCYTEWY